MIVRSIQYLLGSGRRYVKMNFATNATSTYDNRGFPMKGRIFSCYRSTLLSHGDGYRTKTPAFFQFPPFLEYIFS